MSHSFTAVVRQGIMALDKWLQTPVKGLLLDITGVLKEGCAAIPGSVEAIKNLQSANFPFRLVTNETSRPINKILSNLNMLGFEIEEQHLICPVPAVISILKKNNLRPHLLIHPEVISDFANVDTSDPNCVILGDAVEHFNYELLNEGFRKLMEMKKPILFSLGQGKYYRDNSGLVLDVGPFCKALEYATGVEATTVGKPCSEYFMEAVSNLGLKPNEVVMIGDDILYDIGGAQDCGIRSVLVRTGKYTKERDEPHETVVPDGIVNNLQEAINLLLQQEKNV